MDIVTHAVVGASTGALFGRPVLGALVAAAPDLVLGLQRKVKPTRAYNYTHSALFALACTLAAALLGSWPLGALVGLCLLSHLVLDVPTHGRVWAPPLLYPYSVKRYSMFLYEWEFFNVAWAVGLGVSIVWIIACLLLTFVVVN